MENIQLPTGPMEISPRLSDADYDFLRQLVYQHTHIQLGPDKRALLTSRLAKRLRHHGLKTYGEYCNLLRSPAGAEEMQSLIDRISTNHTFFFREEKHFEFLRGTVIHHWQADARRHEPFRIWSAASSTGEEAYSIAVHLAEHFAPAESGRWQIEGTDISERVLEVARRGIYEAARVTGIPGDVLRRHFQRGVNEWAGHFRVKEDLRRRMNFRHWNLLDGHYPFAQPFDLIFCRNVMIYFDRPTQETLVRQLSEKLLPGGYLFVGHSESLGSIKHALSQLGPAIYQKPG